MSKAKPPISNEVKLWHNAEGLGYASVQVNGHWENYRLGTTMFEGWLRTAYGKQNTCTINGQEFPQAPGTAAVKDAVAQLKGIAQQRGLQSEPVIRVGGSMDEIWIDLGNSDWSAVRVTAEGWSIEDQPNVPFVRTGAMRPLPEPAKGGKIQDLKRVLNVRSSDFVLCVAFELQALNPEGPYPTLNAFGEPGDGKSYICNALQRIVDPNSLGIRKISKVEDLLIAARNNRILAFDNMSWISNEISDTFCMLATGIATGKRTNYTDDEEFAFSAMRPVIFNGIPGELTERSDLADRVIKLHIPPMAERRGPSEMEREFLEVWPGVLGALLDGLVGAIRDWQSIKVPNPAHMMDFEQWAEAGCRAMGFREWGIRERL